MKTETPLHSLIVWIRPIQILFDDPELEELYRNTAYDEEVALQISEWMDEGIPVEVLYRTMDYQTGGRPEEDCFEVRQLEDDK